MWGTAHVRLERTDLEYFLAMVVDFGPGRGSTRLRIPVELVYLGQLQQCLPIVEVKYAITALRPRCPDCGNEIDPDWCHCGDAVKDHRGMSHNHSPVPMGCGCGQVTRGDLDEEPEKEPRKGHEDP